MFLKEFKKYQCISIGEIFLNEITRFKKTCHTNSNQAEHVYMWKQRTKYSIYIVKCNQKLQLYVCKSKQENSHVSADSAMYTLKC